MCLQYLEYAAGRKSDQCEQPLFYMLCVIVYTVFLFPILYLAFSFQDSFIL